MSDSVIRAMFPIEHGASADGDNGVRRVRIMTEHRVRGFFGGVAKVGGAVVDGYLRNPVVLWAHDYSQPPIGRCVALETRPGVGIDAQFEFTPPGEHPFADTVRQMWDGGFLNAASIGFMPLEVDWLKEGDEQVPVYTRWELLEFSIVPIPADRDALRLAVRTVGMTSKIQGGSTVSDVVGRAGLDLTETLAQELTALRELVQNHVSDRATLDVDALAKRVVELQGLQQAQQQKAGYGGIVIDESGRELTPVRKGELVRAGQVFTRGELVGVPGFGIARRQLIETGKFAGLTVDDAVFAHNLLTRARRLEPSKVRAPSVELTDIVTRALSSTGVGTGDELVPTGMAAQMWNDAFIGSKVVSNLERIPMPTDPFDNPLSWGPMTWRKGAQNTAPTAVDPATGKSTFTATEQVVEVLCSYDLNEDSIVSVLPSLRAELARSAAEAMDAFVLNADATATATGNINSDDGAPAADSYYLTLGQDGIRHQYLVDNSGQSVAIATTLTDALMRAAIGRLGKYGADPSRLVLFVDPKTYVLSMLGLSNVVTMDKIGANATVLTGQLSSYGGIPVVPSESMPLTEADGKVSTTAGNNTAGQIAIVQRDLWRVGFRRELLIEVDKDIKARQFVMVISFRIAVACRGTRSTAVHTAGIHDIRYA